MHAVADRFDVHMFEQQAAVLPELAAVGTADLYALFFKADPRPPTGHVLAALLRDERVAALRRDTRLDAYASAKATIAVAGFLDQPTDQALTHARRALAEVGERLAAEVAAFASIGVDRGALRRLPAAEREALAKRLLATRLVEFVDRIGRWRRDMDAFAHRSPAPPMRVELGDRLPDVVASERALLRHRIGRLDFLARLADAQVVQRARQRVSADGRGPLTLLMDVSQSTNIPLLGASREVWIKALTLAALDLALAQRRPVDVVAFGATREQRRWHFTPGQAAVEARVEVAEVFFAGGTSYTSALDRALDQPESDVLMVTDGAGRLSISRQRRLVARMRERRLFVLALDPASCELGDLPTELLSLDEALASPALLRRLVTY